MPILFSPKRHMPHYTPTGRIRRDRTWEGASVKHIVAVDQFERPWIEHLFADADRMRSITAVDGLLRGKILATLFYEPSTRTRLSFESAMLRLAGQIISTENAREFSSAIKGETIEDTVRIVAGYADGIVIRHHEQGASSTVATVPASIRHRPFWTCTRSRTSSGRSTA
jgi:aspartate carbamoyltransferase catalytic subunit